MTRSRGFPGLVVHVMNAASATQDNEPQPVVITASNGDQFPVGVIEIEKPPQIRLRQLTPEPPKPSGLFITEEFHRHTLTLPNHQAKGPRRISGGALRRVGGCERIVPFAVELMSREG